MATAVPLLLAPGVASAQPRAEGADEGDDSAARPFAALMLSGPDEVMRRADGSTHGSIFALDDVALEAVRHLGQIVVDRSTQAAFDWLGEHLRCWLQCLDDDGEPRPDATLATTCDVLGSLRVQEIASAPDLLLEALVRDVARAVLPTSAPGDYSESVEQLVELVGSLIVPALTGSRSALTQSTVEVVAAELLALAREMARPAVTETGAMAATGSAGLTPEQKVLLLGAGAAASCLERTKQRVHCSAAIEVDRLIELSGLALDAEERRAARRIAAAIYEALTAQELRVRLHTSIDATFDVACVLVAGARGGFSCPDAVSESTVTDRLTAVRLLLHALVDFDAAALVALVSDALDADLFDIAGEGDDGVEDRRRALRLLAGLAQYGATYVDAGSTEEMVAQRRAILESLTREFTDRTARAGDVVVSLGGMLRLFGGQRYALGDTSTHDRFGPLGLTLGAALQYLGDPVGFHADVSFLDLGQYLAFNGGGEIADFDFADVFSPSFSAGAIFGRSLPFFVGVTVGYTRAFEFSETLVKDSLYWGAGVGLYVPFFDVN